MIEVCITPMCGQPAKHRKLCRLCYGKAAALVRHGKSDWLTLVARGLAGACRTRGRRSGKFMCAVATCEPPVLHVQ